MSARADIRYRRSVTLFNGKVLVVFRVWFLYGHFSHDGLHPVDNCRQILTLSLNGNYRFPAVLRLGLLVTRLSSTSFAASAIDMIEEKRTRYYEDGGQC